MKPPLREAVGLLRVLSGDSEAQRLVDSIGPLLMSIGWSIRSSLTEHYVSPLGFPANVIVIIVNISYTASFTTGTNPGNSLWYSSYMTCLRISRSLFLTTKESWIGRQGIPFLWS